MSKRRVMTPELASVTVSNAIWKVTRAHKESNQNLVNLNVKLLNRYILHTDKFGESAIQPQS